MQLGPSSTSLSTHAISRRHISTCREKKEDFLICFNFYYVDVGERFITTCRQREWLPTTALNAMSFNCDTCVTLYTNSSNVITIISVNVMWCIMYINTSKKETLHSFKGQQLQNKSLYHFIIYIGLCKKILALIWHQICNKIP